MEQKEQQAKETTENKEVTYPARVDEILSRTGSRGTITQVKCFLHSEKRSLIRNVKGPVKVGDEITLLECEREARRLR